MYHNRHVWRVLCHLIRILLHNFLSVPPSSATAPTGREYNEQWLFKSLTKNHVDICGSNVYFSICNFILDNVFSFLVSVLLTFFLKSQGTLERHFHSYEIYLWLKSCHSLQYQTSYQNPSL